MICKECDKQFKKKFIRSRQKFCFECLKNKAKNRIEKVKKHQTDLPRCGFIITNRFKKGEPCSIKRLPWSNHCHFHTYKNETRKTNN